MNKSSNLLILMCKEVFQSDFKDKKIDKRRTKEKVLLILLYDFIP